MADAGSAKLRAAAEQLAAAAIEASSSTALAAARESVVELRHIHSGVDKLLDGVDKLRVSVESTSAESKAHVGRIEAALAGIKSAISEQATTSRRLARTKSIQWALSHADIGEFRYYRVPEGGYVGHSQGSSKDLVISILQCFNRGAGSYIPRSTLDGMWFGDSDKAKSTKSVADFHAKLVEQLHTLLGEKPDIRPEAGEKHAIYLPAI